ncbi:MAG: SpoIIE family protein phosphatase [Lachnospiraceae bacterium]|nr:SpoIIE family protein phosphatase [Lachnospiraceae bacterium]
MDIYLKLLGIGIIPVILSMTFYLLLQTTKFSGVRPWIQQTVIGVAFGIIAIYGTVYGVDIGGATANARDAAPLCAGLFFGGPAGIIAGTIGAVYRWLAAEVYGIGVYTKVACSVSTFFAGIYAALIREFVFDKRRPKWYTAFLIGVVIEAFHLLMVFITHIDDSARAIEVVKICTLPMILVNAFAVGLTALVLSSLNLIRMHRAGEHYTKEKPTISERIQFVLLVIVIVSFLATSSLAYVLQTNQTNTAVTTLLKTNIQDTVDEISDITDSRLIDIVKNVAKEYNDGILYSPDDTAKWYGVTEVDIINSDGIITDSTNPAFVGFDMKSGEQSREFMVLANSEGTMAQDYMPISADESIKRKYAGASTDDGGFVQVGIGEEDFYNKVADNIQTVSRNRHIGNTGTLIIVDSKNRIMSCSDESLLDKNLMTTGLWIWDEYSPLKTYQGQAFGEDVYFMFQNEDGYSVIGIYPVKEAMTSRDINIYLNSFCQILVFAFLFAAVYFGIHTVVVKRVNRINDSLEKITGGDLNEIVNVDDTQELATLSREINTTVDRLKAYIAEAAARIDQELEFAKHIQCSALPSDFPAFPDISEFDIFASMDAAREVGGDFYDFYMPKEHKLAFIVADVSGKGIPAAMFMMQAKTMINGFTSAGLPVNQAFSMSNTKLCEENEAEMFVTAWQGILDITNGHIEFANAGHNPPLVYRKDEGWSYLKSKVGFVLAGMDGIQYKLQTMDLNPGDKLFLYTDGIVEAQNVEQELYGEERLITYLNAHTDDDPETTIKGVRANVDEFVGRADQFDDMTMLMVSFNGPGTTIAQS